MATLLIMSVLHVNAVQYVMWLCVQIRRRTLGNGLRDERYQQFTCSAVNDMNQKQRPNRLLYRTACSAVQTIDTLYRSIQVLTPFSVRDLCLDAAYTLFTMLSICSGQPKSREGRPAPQTRLRLLSPTSQPLPTPPLPEVGSGVFIFIETLVGGRSEAAGVTQ